MKCHSLQYALYIALFALTSGAAAAMLDNDGLQKAGNHRRRSSVVVRLHLVRHGETDANKANFVLGQRESPLTQKGIDQAAALGSFIGRYPFWRAYCSDYERTQKTAGLILGGGNRICDDMGGGVTSKVSQIAELEAGQDGETNQVKLASTTAAATATVEADVTETASIIQDARLRERAKGVREGRKKSINYEDALLLFRLESGDDADPPLLESDDDVWARVKSWIDDVVEDACKDAMTATQPEVNSYKDLLKKSERASLVDEAGNEYERTGTPSDGQGPSTTEELGSAIDPRSALSRRNMYEVLAVSHSATIRTAVNRLVPDQLPSNIVRGSGGSDGAAQGMLVVPNTSRTIIDIVAEEDTSLDDDDEVKKPPHWSAELVDLTNTDHVKP